MAQCYTVISRVDEEEKVSAWGQFIVRSRDCFLEESKRALAGQMKPQQLAPIAPGL